MAWVGAMNNIRSCAEKIVFKDSVPAPKAQDSKSFWRDVSESSKRISSCYAFSETKYISNID